VNGVIVTPEQALQALYDSMGFGTSGDLEVVADHLRDGVIEATVWADLGGQDVEAARVRIRVEVVQP
jgi:hypothetical protein